MNNSNPTTKLLLLLAIGVALSAYSCSSKPTLAPAAATSECKGFEEKTAEFYKNGKFQIASREMGLKALGILETIPSNDKCGLGFQMNALQVLDPYFKKSSAEMQRLATITRHSIEKAPANSGLAFVMTNTENFRNLLTHLYRGADRAKLLTEVDGLQKDNEAARLALFNEGKAKKLSEQEYIAHDIAAAKPLIEKLKALNLKSYP